MRTDDRFVSYSSISEIKKEKGHRYINGVKIREPHFLEFDGCTGGHHSIIETRDGTPYGYDNIIIGTNGSRKTIYLMDEDSNIHKHIVKPRIQLLNSDRFIIINSKLYHIPTGSNTTIKASSDDIVERVPNVIDFIGKNKQIEWNGREFQVYTEDLDSDDVEELESSRSFDILNEKVDSSDLREKADSNSTKGSYRDLLLGLVNSNPHIHTINEAERYLNGDLELTDKQKVKREFETIKRKYVTGEITIDVFEDKMVDFFNRNEEYIYVTGDKSDTQLSSFDTDVTEDAEENGNSAFDW
jgi:hypothetical protein